MILHDRQRGWASIIVMFFVIFTTGLLINALQGCSDDDDDTTTFTPTATHTPGTQTPTPGTPTPTCTPMPSPPSYWAQYRHDYRHSGYAPFVGPDNPSVAWINDEFRASYVTTDRDGYLYVSGRITQESDYGTTSLKGLWSLNPDGTMRWSYIDPDIGTLFSPMITNFDRVFVTDGIGNVLCFTTSGELVWMRNFKEYPYTTFLAQPTLSNQSDIIFGYYGRTTSAGGYGVIQSVSKEGNLNWMVEYSEYAITFAPVCDAEGNIYFTIEDRFEEHDYMQQEIYTYLVSLDASGNFRWRFEPTSSVILRGPSLDRFGNVYITTWKELFVFSNDGMLLWQKDIEEYGEISSPCPAISSSGNIFLATKDGSILCLDNDGLVLWTYGRKNYEFAGFSPDIAIDAEGSIYYYAKTKYSTQPMEYFIISLSSNGSLKWEYDLEKYYFYLSSPIIADNNILYFPSDEFLLALH